MKSPLKWQKSTELYYFQATPITFIVNKIYSYVYTKFLIVLF